MLHVREIGGFRAHDNHLALSTCERLSLEWVCRSRWQHKHDFFKPLKVVDRCSVYAQWILVPTRSRSGFASPRGGSLKPPGAPILEKDVAKAESGGGAETGSDLDVITSDQE